MNAFFRVGRFAPLLFAALPLLLPACAPPCNGAIESTVLYARPRPAGGRFIYVDVTNRPALGRRQELRYEGKEFGTFEHVVVIEDPTNQYAAHRKLCFNTYQPLPAETGGPLEEVGLTRLRVAE